MPELSVETITPSTSHVQLKNINKMDSQNRKVYGSVYSYNNFQQIVVRIAVNLILTTNNIMD
jgi:hypothetical protein